MPHEFFPLQIDVRAVQELCNDGEEFLLLDCREPEEHARVHLAGSVHIPMNDVPGRMGELDTHRGRRVVVYCHHGVRSLKVTQWLRQQGFEKAQNMSGGIDAWALLVDTSLPRY